MTEAKPEAPKPRTVDDLRREYAHMCSRAGNLSYEIDAKQKDLDLLHKAMRNLNLEAAKLSTEEAAAKAAEAAAQAAKEEVKS